MSDTDNTELVSEIVSNQLDGFRGQRKGTFPRALMRSHQSASSPQKQKPIVLKNFRDEEVSK